MISPTRQLAEARAARDAARATFDDQFARLRGDPEADSVGGRIAGRLGDDARAAFHQTLDVASESKGIIAGTIAALALWLLRGPILAWTEHLLASEAAPSEEGELDD